MIIFNNLCFGVSWRQGWGMGLKSGELSENPYEEKDTDAKEPTSSSK